MQAEITWAEWPDRMWGEKEVLGDILRREDPDTVLGGCSG